MRIIQNAIRVIDTGEFFKSIDTHDFVGGNLTNGQKFFLDGGKEYFRSSNVNKNPLIEDFRLTTDNTPQEVKDKLLWGTNGKDGKQPFKWVRLADCELSHLSAILETQTVEELYKIVIINLILDKIQKYV